VLGVLGVAVFLLVVTAVKDAALPTRSKVGAQWDLGEPGNDCQPLSTSHPSVSPAFLSPCESSYRQPRFSGLNLIKVDQPPPLNHSPGSLLGMGEGRAALLLGLGHLPPQTLSLLCFQMSWWVHISLSCYFLMVFADC